MFHPDVYSLLLELENKVEPAGEMYEKALSHLRNRLDIETVWLRFVFSSKSQFLVAKLVKFVRKINYQGSV